MPIVGWGVEWGEWDIAYLLEKTFSKDKLCVSLHWSHASDMIDAWTEVGDHVASELRAEKGLLFAVLTSNLVPVLGVKNTSKNVLVHDNSGQPWRNEEILTPSSYDISPLMHCMSP